MAATHVKPPAEYDPVYCASVHEECSSNKVSTTTIRWLLSIFGIPVLAGLLVAYAFYVKVPLTYTEKQEFNALQTQVVKIEEKVKQLPTASQIKDVMKEVLIEHDK